MSPQHHFAVFLNNESNKIHFIKQLLKNDIPQGFEQLKNKHGLLFSKLTLIKFMDEEERHEEKTITQNTKQSLKTMSSGEQKRALLKYLLNLHPDFLILDNPFDNLDTEFQKKLKKIVKTVSDKICIIQLISKKDDLLSFITQYASLKENTLLFHKKPVTSLNTDINLNINIPPPLQPYQYKKEKLIELKNVSVDFQEKPVLTNINWTIKPGEFWQLLGKNGSGKTTILSMITGDSSKAYGQNLYIFGQKKGSGESVWDIKEKIGYFTPSMTDKFSGQHTTLNMIISGLHDSIGLYKTPSEIQIALGKEWLNLIGISTLSNSYFSELTMGQKRLVLTARAMIKHPLLLILDEPTAGLDDNSAALFVTLVNKISKESSTAIVFVSHRNEPGLKPKLIYKLTKTPKGSTGQIVEPSN